MFRSPYYRLVLAVRLAAALVLVCLPTAATFGQLRVRFPGEEAGGNVNSLPQPAAAQAVYAGNSSGNLVVPAPYVAPNTLPGAAQVVPVQFAPMVQPQPAVVAPIYGVPAVAPYTMEPSLGSPVFVQPESSRFYVMAEALWLDINMPANQPLVLDQNTLEPVLNLNDLDLDMELGLRASVGYAFTCQWTLEGQYFGLQQWSDTESTRGGSANLRLPGAAGLALDDFFGADLMTASYTVQLHNAELNLWRRLGESRLSGMLGFRYVNLSETFNIHAIDSDADQSDYNIQASNNLFGGQIGAEYNSVVGDLELQFLGKGGVFGNAAQQSQTLADTNNTILVRNTSTSATNVAFVGEVGVTGLVKLTNWLNLRAGYTAVWLVNVGRAPDQLDFTFAVDSGTTLTANKTAFLHGPSIGLQAQW